MTDEQRLHSSPALAGILIIVLAFALLRTLSLRKVDEREPPIAASNIPFLGHLIGMTRHGAKYIRYLR